MLRTLSYHTYFQCNSKETLFVQTALLKHGIFADNCNYIEVPILHCSSHCNNFCLLVTLQTFSLGKLAARKPLLFISKMQNNLKRSSLTCLESREWTYATISCSRPWQWDIHIWGGKTWETWSSNSYSLPRSSCAKSSHTCCVFDRVNFRYSQEVLQPVPSKRSWKTGYKALVEWNIGKTKFAE